MENRTFSNEELDELWNWLKEGDGVNTLGQIVLKTDLVWQLIQQAKKANAA